MPRLDAVEAAYAKAIDAAARGGDSDTALELSTGLTEYRRHYRVPPLRKDEHEHGHDHGT